MDKKQVDPQTVMFFEIEGGWNVSGGPELMIKESRHIDGKIVVGFVDGSIHEISRSQINDLLWNP